MLELKWHLVDARVRLSGVALDVSVSVAEPERARPDWAALYASEGPALLRYARRLSASDDEARDVLQETFVRAMRTSNTPSDPGRYRPWLYRIVTNEVIDRQRRQRRFLFLPLDAVRSPAPSMDTSEAELIRQALRSIPPDQAAALVLRLQEGRSRSEIAAHLGISEEGVKSRLARGRLNFAAAYRRLERGLAR
jgi:RNA polymerase sigma-70 factor, ECF subfamily